MKRIILFYLSSMLFLVACGPRTYTNDAFSHITSKHRTIAILPFDVSMQLRPRQMEKLGTEKVKELELTTGKDIQQSFFNWILRRGNRKGLTVQVQEVSETNRLLQKAVQNGADIRSLSAKEICTLLNVDAIVKGDAALDQPISRELAAVIDIVTLNTPVFIPRPPAQTKKANIAVLDADSGNRIWSYQHNIAGGTFSSADDLINAMMRNASRKFPYTR